MHVHVHVEVTCRAVAHAWYHVNMAAYLSLSSITLWYRVLLCYYLSAFAGFLMSGGGSVVCPPLLD